MKVKSQKNTEFSAPEVRQDDDLIAAEDMIQILEAKSGMVRA